MLLIIGLLLLSLASSAFSVDFGVLRPFQHVNGQVLRLDTEERHYKLVGLKPYTGYEVRVSWPASVSAVRGLVQSEVCPNHRCKMLVAVQVFSWWQLVVQQTQVGLMAALCMQDIYAEGAVFANSKLSCIFCGCHICCCESCRSQQL